MRWIALFPLPLALAACERQSPPPDTDATASFAPVETATPPSVTSEAPTPETETLPRPSPPDTASNARRDPQQVLRAYAAALSARQWDRAARAWGQDSGVTAQTLKAAYDRPEAPRLTIGKGQEEGAAGSLYYEAPVTLRFGPEETPQTGTLVLRRVNDVPGAKPEQLRWHIERSTIGAEQ